MQSVNKIIL